MKATRLLRAPALWSPGLGFLRPEGGAAVAVDGGGEAVEAGTWYELAGRYRDLEQEEGEGMLLPGLVDCHAHLELAALHEKVPGGDGIAAWVARLVAAWAPCGEEALEAAALEAAKEMRALGTVAVADVCTKLATAPILLQVGLAGISLLEVVGSLREEAEANLDGALRRLERHPPEGEVDVQLIPHSPHGTHPAVLQRLLERIGAAAPAAGKAAAVAEASAAAPSPPTPAPYLGAGAAPAGPWREAGPGVRSVHAAEHPDEEAWLLRGEGPFASFLRSRGAEPTGLSALQSLDAAGAIGSQTLLVHLVTASEDELRMARSRGAVAVLCPRSNLHIGGALPDLAALRRSGIPWTLGTDSLASSPSHDLLEELHCLAEAFPEVPAGELLAAATLGGATALGLQRHPWVRISGERASRLAARFEEGAQP